MGVPLLRAAFQELRATPVAFAFSPKAKAETPVEQLSEIVSRAEGRVGGWRSHVARLMEEIPVASNRHLGDGGAVTEIVTDLEKLRDEVRDRFDRSVTLKNRADSVAAATDRDSLGLEPAQIELFLERSDRMRELMAIEIEAGSLFLDFLTGFLAGIDPGARGGPTFDRADDLIAYLNR